jgi:hypothetical protein
MQLRGGEGIIPYITASDPDLPTTEKLIIELARAGATTIELVFLSAINGRWAGYQRASNARSNIASGYKTYSTARAPSQPRLSFSAISIRCCNLAKRLASGKPIDGVLVID